VRSLLCLLLLAPLAWADLKIEGPDKVAVYKTVRLKATGADKDAAYIWDVDREEAIDADESGPKFSFSAPPGVYRIKLRSVSLKDGKTTIETARFAVTIGPDLPPPKPLPDDPPAPTPDAPLIKALKDAYATDPSPLKADSLSKLTELFRGAGLLLTRPGVKTLQDLHDDLKAARVSLIGETLPGVRKVVAAEVAKLGDKPDAPIDADAARAVFAKITAALEGVIK